MATAQLARTLADLDPHLEQWDRLAVSASRPMMRPAWLLAWWRGHSEFSDGSELRVALAVDDRGLVGVLPMYVNDPGSRMPVHEVLGAGTFWGQGPLLRGDVTPETLRLLTEVLSASSPEPVVLNFDAVDTSRDWPQHMAAVWPPRSAWLYTRAGVPPCLTVTLSGGFHDWLRSTGRASGHRRALRRLAERGVTLRRSTTAFEYRRDLASLARLHHVRWDNDSLWLSPAVEIALESAGSQLIDSGGVRLWLLEGEQGVIGASLFACAGMESCFLVTAYDRAWGAYGPGITTIVAGIEDAFARGHRAVDLGHGRFDYKRVLANSDRPLAWLRMFPHGRSYPLARAYWAPRQARERLHGARVRLAARRRVTDVRAKLRTRDDKLASRGRGS
jgi:CelD/BcsL family acetyltransferase involved in cellulose biosynthesis